jgi:4-carboxymuconolactone decarboxylase
MKTMKLLTASVLSLSLLASASAQTNQAVGASGSGAQGSQAIKIIRSGSQPAEKGPAENFTGSVRVDSRFQATDPGRASGARVTFDPGARTAWHSHPLGQTLIVTAGVGRVQRWGDRVDEIRQGDLVWIPPGQKHWHGASPDAAMSHIAIVELLNGKSTDWMEKVSDAQYSAPVQTQRSTSLGQPGPAPQMMRELAPKLADLTDNVLFGDIWERTGLSKRDRSLIVVATLIAMNRPDQLRSHMARARENGVTQDELVEVITHLAFYAGWPSAVTAISVANEVFGKK